jgi:DUF177 domain-containing protein
VSWDRPLLEDVADLLDRPNTQRRVQRSSRLEGLAITGARVPADGMVDVAVLLESMPSAIRITGRVTAPWVGECRRCLETVTGRLDMPIAEVFELDPTEGETFPIKDDQIDLEPAVREVAILGLPLAPLCGDECRGPDPDRFPTGIERTLSERDPRWSALDDLDFG